MQTLADIRMDILALVRCNEGLLADTIGKLEE